MKQKQKKFLAIALVVFLTAVLFTVPAFAEGLAEFPALPKNVCVVDDADMLSSDTEAWLDELNYALQEECKGATIAVLTVQDTGAIATADYATQAFNEWGVGDKDENNGVLVLLCRTSPQFADGDYYVALGKGLDGTQLSSELKTMLNKKMEKPFAAGDYDTAVRDTVKAIEAGVRNQGEQGTFFHSMWMQCGKVIRKLMPKRKNYALSILYVLIVIMVVGGAIAKLMSWLGCLITGEEKSTTSRRDRTRKDRDTSNRSRSRSRSRSSRSRSSTRMGGGSSFGGGAGRG